MQNGLGMQLRWVGIVGDGDGLGGGAFEKLSVFQDIQYQYFLMKLRNLLVLIDSFSRQFYIYTGTSTPRIAEILE